ncbi:MAG: glucoamylase family protein [Isosphaeraceae bacterium]|nr:glucoamylase family protein [Isosphaeraceae bacterium]
MALYSMIRRAKSFLPPAPARGGVPPQTPNEEQPLRSELFSVDQLELHAKAVAGWHQVDRARGPDRLLPRLKENEAVLVRTYELVTAAVVAKRRIAPASEWLLDNFYLIEEQIRTAQRHLPRGYSRELPRLRNGPSAGYPRGYDIALELIAHADGRVDAEGLRSFVAAYQTVAPLTLGELWAIPIMLRLALIENLRRIAVRIAADKRDRNNANRWADRLTEVAEQDARNLILVLADMVKSHLPMTSAFIAELARRLQGQGPALAFPLTWAEQRLADEGQTIERLVQSEGQRQAADQVSIGNSIGSLRLLGATDWREFVEAMSLVDQELREDPAGVFGAMDFATRDLYRHAIEEVAKGCSLTQVDVAHRAVALAREAVATADGDDRATHVGFYLIGKGRPQLERAAQSRRSVGARVREISRRFPLRFYLGAILALMAALTTGFLAQGRAAGSTRWALGLVAIPLALGVSQLALTVVNWLVTMLIVPKRLPKLDFSRGLPPETRTLVAVPTMLVSEPSVDELLDGLEVRYLANQDDHLHFALLTDFQDAPHETMPGDEALVRRAQEGIESLNAKYRGDRGDRFFLFHRPRRWDAREQVWMGYERKRGKLSALNALLRGRPGDRFSLVVGETSVLPSVRYVITLDTDTHLPRDVAHELVGAIAHPLNRPRFGEGSRRVCEGYGLLQPRVAESMPVGGRSWFLRLFGGESGLDPYTRTVSDVYQDAFGEGSFIGKGIYDVDAFICVLGDQLPENLILSHDLLEGCYARTALVSDVQLYESSPPRYLADVARRHRWVRGDWQISPWLLPHVPGPGGVRLDNPISALSRWKILDNLRRSLVPPALVLVLVMGWSVLSPAWFWTLVVAGIGLFPTLLRAVTGLLHKPPDLTIGLHLRATLRSIGRDLAQSGLMLAFLPYEAYSNLDAIVRTSVRMHLTHTHLLEWTTSSEAGRISRADRPVDVVRAMAIAPALAAALAVGLGLSRPAALAAAWPWLGLWFASPWIAWWISRSTARREERMTGDQVAFLNGLARRTWRFFETFVGPADHWLPPDNFQENPVAVVAHRTSPTNMGLALLANLAAYDFGYISPDGLIDRTSRTLDTMEGLDRFRGHFFNWYDTLTLSPLPPRYVSTVDSGNLAGHLLCLKVGLDDLPDRPILPPRAFEGLTTTLQALTDAAGRDGGPRLGGSTSSEISSRISRLRSQLESLSRGHSLHRLPALAALATELAGGLGASPGEDVAWWAQAFDRQCRDHLTTLTLLAPWLLLAPDAAPLGTWVEERLRRGAVPTLREVARLGLTLPPADDQGGEGDGVVELRRTIAEASTRAGERITAIEKLSLRCGEFADLDYQFLYDRSRRLLAIGYNVDDRRTDASFYDLLASEARLASFVGIAQGRLPQEHWFALGRLLTATRSGPVLISWSGSMFEYLMPLLVMPTYEGTLLDQTCRAAVARQAEYGAQRGVPWGVSESGFNTTDVHLNYQYRAFGVPGLGLKRGLVEDLVVAPYATVLALMVAPGAAYANLRRMAGEGFQGRYGFYEAIDYTASRLGRGQSCAIIRSFMAHHQGMSFLSLAYRLLDRPMQRRFESDPSVQATELLLQERIPVANPFYPHAVESSVSRRVGGGDEALLRVYKTSNTRTPEVQLLSNGRYVVMVTNAGGGYSRWKDLAVTRWHEDTTRDNTGSFCYLRDVTTGAVWSAGHQPSLARAKDYEAIFSQSRAEIRRRDGDIDTHLEIAVSPEDDIELRRITITNRSRERRTIDIASYAEVVLATAAADAAHPAFSNLFVQTEILRSRQAIICTRRPRSDQDQTPLMFHLMAVHGTAIGEMSYETDRLKFLGRGRSVANPEALDRSPLLSNGEGSVLDPIVAIRQRVTIEAEESARIDLVTGVAGTRDDVLGLIEKYRDKSLADRVFDLAWSHGQVVLRQLNASEADAQLYGRLESSILYANPAHRANPSLLMKNRRGQSSLWGHGISGDLPIVLVRIADQEKIELVRQLVQAHAYWRIKGLTVDLVIWNEDPSGYRQVLQDQIMALIAAGSEAQVVDRPGGVFVRRPDQMSDEDRTLLQTVARVIVDDSAGTLGDQLERRGRIEAIVPRMRPTRGGRAETATAAETPQRDLSYFNGFGGFTRDGHEYVITTSPGRMTPEPWVNVLANPYFGTVVSESGGAYTWCENAHELRLTPWYNDPVTDASGEALYLRDEESGRFWSPTPLPARGATPYVSRHGFGYSVFEHAEDGIASELWVYVATDAPVKFAVLRVRNESERPRRLSATAYCEWVLGELRPRSLMYVTTEVDPKSGAVFARNPNSAEFGERVAFLDANDAARSVTGDRAEFLGRNGTPASPAALTRARLSGRVGAALDPCAAMQVPFDLAAGQEHEVCFTLGIGRDADDARNLIQRFRGSNPARRALESVWSYWNHTLGAVNVDTPDPSINFLANGWLLYQTLACRVWARSGYYQSGGAFGFRDQLQDVMALLHAEPRLLREHLLRCASHQFREGDVQHWWHPPTGRGVRTHFSDDYLWLPLATCRYVKGTGDTGVLDERIPFLAGRLLKPEEEAYYDLPSRSDETATLYDHCVRSITNGLKFGPHGLPLIGCGDWNDGMNLVGQHGKGESVWLAFFLFDVLSQFADIARGRGDTAFEEQCVGEADRLRLRIEANAWDGEWYRRAYFDNGEPIGSATNPECQIDSIPQSWAVLSGAGDPQRSRTAMDAVDRRLVRRNDGLIQLFDPPFDKSSMNPGYIKGYVPGVRENGGQYTHAAVWATMAFATLGDHRRAWELFSLINPTRHGATPEGIATYRVEPYVVAADVYAVPPHTGRGGWTWYTGSAGWMYRLIIESLLGVRLEVDTLRFEPCLPADWPSYKLHYRYRETVHHITVRQSKAGGTVTRVILDGVEQADKTIRLKDDRLEHFAEIEIG